MPLVIAPNISTVPTHVGMNLIAMRAVGELGDCPHTRGDEPAYDDPASYLDHCPHTRGDEPAPLSVSIVPTTLSPHTWG